LKGFDSERSINDVFSFFLFFFLSFARSLTSFSFSFRPEELFCGMATQISVSVISSMTNVFVDYVGRYPEMHFARGNSRDGSTRTAIDARKIVEK